QQLAAFLDIREVGIFDLNTRQVRRMPIDDEQLTELLYSPDGTRLYGTSPTSDVMYVWDTATRSRIAERKLQPRITALAISPDGKRILSAGGTANVVSEGKTIWTDTVIHAWD